LYCKIKKKDELSGWVLNWNNFKICMKKYLVFIALIVTLISCLDTIVPPLIITGKVTDIDTLGAVFHSRVTALGNKEVVEFGFVWDTNRDPTLEYGEKYIVHSPAKIGNYDVKVSYGLKPQTTYFVRAFIRTADVTTYGEQTGFVSLGSKTAEINSISPLLGSLTDTLVIEGHYFSSRSPIVKIDGLKAQIIRVNQDSILIQLPRELKSKTSVVTIDNQGVILQAKDSFKLISPVITTLTPKTGTYGDEVTVTGKNFLKCPKTLTVYFDKVPAIFHVVDDQTIRVTIPNEINKSPCSITVTMNNQPVQSADQYSLLPMTVTDFSPKTVLTGGTITITGSNFSPLVSGNIVTIGGVRTLAKSVTKNSIEVIVPTQDTAIYDTRNAVVKVEVGGNVQALTNTLLINDKWFRKSNAPQSLRHVSSICYTCPDVYNYYNAQSFVINKIAYIGLNMNSEFWAYNTENDTWKKLAPFPGTPRLLGTGFVYLDKIYFGEGYDGASYDPVCYGDWWEYDTSTNHWTQKANFPGGATYTFKGFATNNECYMTNGFYRNNRTGYTVQIWKYNPPLDIWSKFITDVSTIVKNTTYWRLAKGSKEEAFVGFGSSNSDSDQLMYTFNANTNTLNPIASFPSSGNGTLISLYLNGTLYIKTTDEVYFYDKSTGVWKFADQKTFTNFHDGIGFEVNNLGYVGLGGSNMMYEFDPNR